MIIAPETEIYLLKSPLQVDELQQIDFANATAQANYFQSLPKLALMRSTYQRENDSMVVNFNIEAIRSYNYVMYKNRQYSDKWFYAFIVGLTYESNSVTSVQIKTDVFQSYMFDYDIKRSYIKRETVDDDTFGKHIVSESLDYGDYVLKSVDIDSLITNSTNYNSKSALIVIQCSERVGDCLDYTGEVEGDEVDDMYIIGGVPQGCWYYMFYNTTEQLEGLRTFKKNLDTIGKGNAILNIFIAPQQVVDTRYVALHMYDKDGHVSPNIVTCYIARGNTFLPKQLSTKTISRPTTIGNYTPHNSKVLCYPYNYILVSNNSGSAMDFHFEDFNGNPEFRTVGTLSVNNCFCLMPNNSKKSPNLEYGINTEMMMGTSLPSLSWDSDYYLNWIAQNGNTLRLQAQNVIANEAGDFVSSAVKGTGELGLAGGLLAGGASLIGGLTDISNMIEQTEEKVRQAKAVPNSVSGNLGAGDLAFAIFGSVGFKYYNYQIREEFARKIDRYFDMFGYRVNEIKTPNLKSRRYWNYIQTIGVNLEGNIPQEALMELKNMYNTGLTIWHNPSNFLNYDLTNSII